MKSLSVAVAILACIVLAQTASLNEEQKTKAEQHRKICLEETKADPEIVKKIREGEFPEDPKLKEFNLCFAKRADFLNEKGEIQVAVIKKKIQAMDNNAFTEEQIDKIVAKCAIAKDTPVETAWQSSKCFHQSLPKDAIIA